MRTKQIEVVDAIHIIVDCEENDSTDIKCGGAPILGYDFFVSPDENIEKLKEIIKETLKNNNLPLMEINVQIRKDFPVSNLWTVEKIKSYISEHHVC